jgi:hypothetical protein
VEQLNLPDIYENFSNGTSGYELLTLAKVEYRPLNSQGGVAHDLFTLKYITISRMEHKPQTFGLHVGPL